MKRLTKLSLLAGMILALMFTVPAAASPKEQEDTAVSGTVETPKKTGLVKEGRKYYFYNSKGKRVTKTWKTVNGKRYYFSSKGYAATYSVKLGSSVYVFNTKAELIRPKKTSIVKVGKHSYYVNSKGIASTGWLKIGSKLYYADSLGRFYKNKKYQGVSFGASGAAKSNDAAKLKLETMKVAASITKGCKTSSQKLNACWNYVVGRMRYLSDYPNLNKKGWQKTLAYRALGTMRGNCYGYACAFAALASEIGYDPYVICGLVPGSRDGRPDGMTRHCWVKINGRYYDPEGQAKGWLRGVYGSSGYPIYHIIHQTVNFKNSNA